MEPVVISVEDKDKPKAMLHLENKCVDVSCPQNKGNNRRGYASDPREEKLLFFVITLMAVGLVCFGTWNLHAKIQVLEQTIIVMARRQDCECKQASGPGATDGTSFTKPSPVSNEMYAFLASYRQHEEPVYDIIKPAEDMKVDEEYESDFYYEYMDYDAPDIVVSAIPQVDTEGDDATTSSVRKLVSSVNARTEGVVHSRHVREASWTERSSDWLCEKLKKKAKRDKRKHQKCNSVQTATFKAEFSKFVYDSAVNYTQWNTSVTIYPDLSTGFDNNGTALPFYTYDSPKTRPRRRIMDKTDENKPGSFTVQKSGLYFLHLNITMADFTDTQSLALFRNGEAVQCCQNVAFQCPPSPKNVGNTHTSRACTLAGSLELEKNDKLEVRTMAPDMRLWLTSTEISYFRVVLVEAEKKQKFKRYRRKHKTV